MAHFKVLPLFLLALLVFSMLATEVLAGSYGEGSLKPKECLPKCRKRCSNTRYHKPCMFFCRYCCKKCLCVPPGTYGNKQVCPCYNNWKTQQGGPKCP
ncbi:gibberellin-regulated protein 6-like [Silene latifolia]|uniref:gibberellin-regulated protein 6-like n=1 Tax=Silene latifolia TaxID=37657 RepID=UPI003D76A50F